MENKYVWIFHGAGGRFASGVFQSKEKAEAWIKEHNLQGVLTKYPMDVGVYDWAVENGYFIPQKEIQKQSEFIQKFTTASQEHYHFEDD